MNNVRLTEQTYPDDANSEASGYDLNVISYTSN